MKDRIVKWFIRSRFALSSTAAASGRIRAEADLTLAQVEPCAEEAARRPVRVPPMRGVDEDMRDWSLCMLLEHNTIVNREMTRIVVELSQGLSVTSRLDPKKDVMPSPAPGLEQVDLFRASVSAHLRAVAAVAPPKKGPTFLHPIFGPLDAHGWHCMLGLHLWIHRQQAEVIRARLASSS